MDNQAIALHGHLSATRHRWAAATRWLTRWIDATTHRYVAWSGGKDSTVVAALAHQLCPGIPIVRRSHGIDLPDVPGYCAQLAAHHGWNYHVVQVADRLEDPAWIEAWATDPDSLRRHHGKEPMTQIVSDLLAAPIDGAALGLRQDEADHRRILIATRSPLYQRRDGTWMCHPIARWTTTDVWAWLAHHDIPWCPAYDRLRAAGAPDHMLRIGNSIGIHNIDRGRAHWLRRCWPDEWARLTDTIPALNRWR